jgi:hypothetical protein
MTKRHLVLVLGLMLVLAAIIKVIMQNYAALSQPASNRCVMNLWAIVSAKSEWQLENKKQGNEAPTQSDIQPYMGAGREGAFPHCPDGGLYKIGRLSDPPTCSIGGINHSLPSDWRQYATNQ